MLAIVILCVCCTQAPCQVRAIWYHTTPMVTDQSQPQDVILEAGIEGSPTAVRLFLASNGTEISLVNDGSGVDTMAGDGVYTAVVGAADIVHNFTPDDVNRNFIGYLRLYTGATRLGQYNIFFDILTDDIPLVDIRCLSDDIQYTQHLVNIVYPEFFDHFLRSPVIQYFYTQFGDDYDFINLIYGIAHFGNRFHITIRNDVQGIGALIFDGTAAYGSDGRLLCGTIFPIPGFFDGASPSYQHELGHQWINYLPVPPLDYAIPHWPLSDLASGIMGWGKGRGSQGLSFNYDLVPNGGDYTLVANRDPKVFKDLDLYLMGLIGPNQVGEHFVFDDQEQSIGSGILRGPVTTVTIDDILDHLGPRVPDHTSSPKEFAVATIIVSRDGLLSEDAMRFYDYFSARAMEEKVVPYSSGFAKGLAKPFYLSTSGLGRIDARIKVPERPCALEDDASMDIEDVQILAQYWLSPCCWPQWCEGADLNHNGIVNWHDFACLAQQW